MIWFTFLGLSWNASIAGKVTTWGNWVNQWKPLQTRWIPWEELWSSKCQWREARVTSWLSIWTQMHRICSLNSISSNSEGMKYACLWPQHKWGAVGTIWLKRGTWECRNTFYYNKHKSLNPSTLVCFFRLLERLMESIEAQVFKTNWRNIEDIKNKGIRGRKEGEKEEREKEKTKEGKPRE